MQSESRFKVMSGMMSGSAFALPQLLVLLYSSQSFRLYGDRIGFGVFFFVCVCLES